MINLLVSLLLSTAFSLNSDAEENVMAMDRQLNQLILSHNAKAAAFVSNSLKNPVKVSIEHLDSTINTGHVEAAPFYLNDSTIVYSSLITDQKYFYLNTEDSTSNEPFRKIYKAEKAGEGHGHRPGPAGEGRPIRRIPGEPERHGAAVI